MGAAMVKRQLIAATFYIVSVALQNNRRPNNRMARPRKQNKLPKTSISVSEELWEVLTQRKPKRQTMDEFLRYMISYYYTIKDEFSFVEDAYNKASQKNTEYCRIIEDLKRQLGNRVEPARGVAASSNQSTERIQEEVIQ